MLIRLDSNRDTIHSFSNELLAFLSFLKAKHGGFHCDDQHVCNDSSMIDHHGCWRRKSKMEYRSRGTLVQSDEKEGNVEELERGSHVSSRHIRTGVSKLQNEKVLLLTTICSLTAAADWLVVTILTC